MSPFDRAAAGCRHSLQSLLTLGEQLTDAQWAASTDCPDWTVADVYAHVIGVELWMAAGAEALPGAPQTWIDQQVEQRRGTARADLLAELRAVVARREVQLTDELREPDAPAWWVWSGSNVPFAVQLAARTFDIWTHEQDVRRAVGLPGNLGSAGAQVTRDLILLSLPKVVARAAAAPAGSTVRFTTLGEVLTDVAVHLDEQGRAALVPTHTHQSTAHATMCWESFARMSTGRTTRDDQLVWLGGDTELGERVLTRMNIAP